MAATAKSGLGVLLVGGDGDILKQIKVRLESYPDVTFVGLALASEEGIRKCRTLRPDVVVLDFDLVDGGGLELARRIRKRRPDAKVVGYTMLNDPQYVTAAFDAGIGGFVVKGSGVDMLGRAIRAVHNGRTFLDPKLLRCQSNNAGTKYGATNHAELMKTSLAMANHGGDRLRPMRTGKRPTRDTCALAEEAKTYIMKNLKPSLSVKAIAAAMNFNAPDLERAFRRTEGMTIKQYIDIQCRAAIVELLKLGNQKGCALAQELGFRTDQAFYRWIKRVFGVPFRQLATKHLVKGIKT